VQGNLKYISALQAVRSSAGAHFTHRSICEQAQVRQSAQACQRLRALAPMLEAQYKAALTARSEAARAEQDRRQTLNDGFQEMISEMTVKIEVYTYIFLCLNTHRSYT
jgi:hypothetical protein